MLIISYLVRISTAVINEDRQMLTYKTYQKCFNDIISQNMHNIISYRSELSEKKTKIYVKSSSKQIKSKLSKLFNQS